MNASNMLDQIKKAALGKESEKILNLMELNSSNSERKSSRKNKQKEYMINLDNTFVIVDEAHNLFNSITNGSANAIGLYNMIMDAENIKILFLTGSPIVNDPFELAVCFNMLAGKFDDGSTLFGEDYLDFTKYFVHHPAPEKDGVQLKVPSIKNKDKFMDRIMGLVSYYGADEPELLKLLPKMPERIVRKVPMSPAQYARYVMHRDREIEEASRVAVQESKKIQIMKPQGFSSSYRVRSRQISNCMYPMYATKVEKDDKGRLQFKTDINELKDENLIFRNSSPKERDEKKQGLEVWSPKSLSMLRDLQKHLPFKFYKGGAPKNKKPSNKKKSSKESKDKSSKNDSAMIGPGYIYSQFLDYGIEFFARILMAHGFIEIKNMDDALKAGGRPTFAMIHGGVDPEMRAELIKLYGSPENHDCKIISVLFITSTGSEGISLIGSKWNMTMEPFWHYSRISQLDFRGARLDSHVHLPERERIIQSYIYLSDYPTEELQFESENALGNMANTKDLKKISQENMTLQKEIMKKEQTTDVYLFNRSIHNQILNNSFLKAAQEVSIDCMKYYKHRKDIKCRVCAPSDDKLFIEKLEKDMEVPSRCKPLVEEKIKVKSVIVEIISPNDTKIKKEFKYSESKEDSERPIRIYDYDSQLGGYKEIFEDNPYYDLIMKKLKK